MIDRVNDDRIINLFFARDQRAVKELQKYKAYLYTIASNILCPEDAEECVNDVLLRAWETIPPSRPAYLRGFLAKITRNSALDRYRVNRAAKRGGGQVDLLISELSDCIPSKLDLEAEYEGRILSETINKFLGSLDEENCFVFMRRYWYGDAVKEIAEGCSISESNVKSKLFRSRRKLREYLEKEELI